MSIPTESTRPGPQANDARGAARCLGRERARHRRLFPTGGNIGAGLGYRATARSRRLELPDRFVGTSPPGYPHKVLTGRADRLETLRQEDGLSGFLKRSESEYDSFGAGHAGTAISAGYGMAVARDLNGDQFKVVSILGDGALTCGLAYEGLNNAGASDRDFIVILNDNEMSIAPNVGAMSKYLTSIQRNPLYNRVRSAIGSVMDAAPPLAGWDAGEKWKKASRPSSPGICRGVWSATSDPSTATTSKCDAVCCVRD